MIFIYLPAALINWLTFIYRVIICFNTAFWSLYSSTIIMEMQNWSKIVINEFHNIFLLRILLHLHDLSASFIRCCCKTQLWLILFVFILYLSCVWIYAGQMGAIIFIKWLVFIGLSIVNRRYNSLRWILWLLYLYSIVDILNQIILWRSYILHVLWDLRSILASCLSDNYFTIVML